MYLTAARLFLRDAARGMPLTRSLASSSKSWLLLQVCAPRYARCSTFLTGSLSVLLCTYRGYEIKRRPETHTHTHTHTSCAQMDINKFICADGI
jgi:hypothetical protein